MQDGRSFRSRLAGAPLLALALGALLGAGVAVLEPPQATRSMAARRNTPGTVPYRPYRPVICRLSFYCCALGEVRPAPPHGTVNSS